MNDDLPSSDELNETTLVLANIAAVTSSVMKSVSGNDISTALNGETLTRQMLHQLAISSVASEASQGFIPAV